jgi:hypothetical protein
MVEGSSVPDFAHAEISATTEDLTEYKEFLRKLKVGSLVKLPLKQGETPRRVMRALNIAARQSGIRLSRLPSDADSVRFKIMPPNKRIVNLSPEARRARVEKARATREARRRAAEAS